MSIVGSALASFPHLFPELSHCSRERSAPIDSAEIRTISVVLYASSTGRFRGYRGKVLLLEG